MESVVLISGGLDSVVLAAQEAVYARVHPVYVSVGLAWEAAERDVLQSILSAEPFVGRVEPLTILEFTMRDVYAPTHWAIVGTPPAYDTPDEDVYLTGRNLVLLSKAGVFAAARKVKRVAIGPLAGNPFPDATPEFFAAMARAMTLGLDFPIEVATPFATLHKEDVIKLGVRLRVPLERTLSCMNPVVSAPGPPVPHSAALHCGLCSKCRERRDAFAAAGIDDHTTYARASPR